MHPDNGLVMSDRRGHTFHVSLVQMVEENRKGQVEMQPCPGRRCRDGGVPGRVRSMDVIWKPDQDLHRHSFTTRPDFTHGKTSKF